MTMWRCSKHGYFGDGCSGGGSNGFQACKLADDGDDRFTMCPSGNGDFIIVFLLQRPIRSISSVFSHTQILFPPFEKTNPNPKQSSRIFQTNSARHEQPCCKKSCGIGPTRFVKINHF
ncbi:hypothetical protein R6Q59_026509 [Mikania micrantha]